jgi:predicted transposase YbfD/YdcC
VYDREAAMEKKVSAFVALFENIPDERQEWKIKHKPVDIMFIAVVATIAFCDDWEDIEWFAKKHEGWFRKYIELPNGVPSHDTIERVFSWIDPERFRKMFLSWVAPAMGVKTPGVVAIDGKTMRGTKEVGKRALHVVNAWFSENGLILGQEFTKEKSNEMKAIPELIDILDVTGHIVTTDAGGTYKEIASKIISGKGGYVLALKGNQVTMLEDVKLFFDNEISDKSSKFHIEKATKTEKGHGRIENRTYFITSDIDWLAGKDEWEGLKSIGAVSSRVENTATGEVTEETRYFISSLGADVGRFAYAVRNHWGVESMHWSLDKTFNEDGRRSRRNNSAKNPAMLLRLSYDIIKSGGIPKRMTLKRARKEALVNESYLEKLISSVF